MIELASARYLLAKSEVDDSQQTGKRMALHSRLTVSLTKARVIIGSQECFKTRNIKKIFSTLLASFRNR